MQYNISFMRYVLLCFINIYQVLLNAKDLKNRVPNLGDVDSIDTNDIHIRKDVRTIT